MLRSIIKYLFDITVVAYQDLVVSIDVNQLAVFLINIHAEGGREPALTLHVSKYANISQVDLDLSVFAIFAGGDFRHFVGPPLPIA